MFNFQGIERDVKEKGIGIYGMVVMQNGREVGRRLWRCEERNNIHSLSKSFLSCAAGIAIDEGLLSLDDQVISYFPEKISGSPSKAQEALLIRHLLTMSPGHTRPLLMGNQRDDLEELDWVKHFLNQPFEKMPGSFYQYDTGNSYLVSAIIQRQAGQTLLEYLKPRLFAPLNIRNPQWFTCPLGITLGGGGLHLTISEIARFGQMLLDGGMYEGRQLVPRAYLEQATQKQIDTAAQYEKKDWVEGYGFQFWRCSWKDAYRGDGAYGQYAVILPGQDAHVSITAHEEKDTQMLLDLVWDHVMPQIS